MKQIKRRSLTWLVLFFCNFSAIAQEPSSFSFTPAKPTNGELVELMYNAKQTPISGAKKVTAVVYQFNNYQWEAVDLAFTGANNLWKASFKVPDNCGIIAIKFKGADTIDNNHDNGYFLQFMDKDRKGLLAPGAYAGWGLARSPKLNMNIPGYMKFQGISDTASFYWLGQEISYNQNARGILVLPYAIAAKAYLKDGANSKLLLANKYLTRPEASEDELLKARAIALQLTGNIKTKDSIDEVLRNRFPQGSLARLAAYKNISTHKDMAEVLKASEQFLKDFPVSTNTQFDEDNWISYGTVYQNIIILGPRINKDTQYLSKYVSVLPYIILSTVYYKIVDIPFSRKDQSPAKLLPLSEMLMQRYDYFIANRPQQYAYLSPLEWKEEVNQTMSKYILPIHVSLLMSAGRNKEAMEYALKAQYYLKYKNATLNNLEAVLLQKSGDTKLLKTVLTKGLYENQSTPEMVAMLKSIYVKAHQSEKGFEAYVESLKNPADKISAQKEAVSSMMNKPMPEWSMKDLNDKIVTSKALRGKTVIMDFWATWCVPCKASFPGMKLAVEKYKNDPNVVFYFVDTEERTADYKAEVRKYIKDNNYPFNILFDNMAENGKTTGEVFDRICKAFTISGIPQKLFVDKKGNLRFISIGYKGSATALADDISIMVELTKAVNE